jgi:putative oxidoreductase
MLDILLHGAQWTDGALLINRLLLGSFFFFARFRFLYDPSKAVGDRFLCAARHESLRNKMCHCGWRSGATGWAWFAALTEIFGGLGVLFGLLTVPAALGLLAVTACATVCTAKPKVMEQHPVDRLDYISCYLWRVEGLYIGMALAVLFAGPGRYSLDWLFWG